MIRAKGFTLFAFTHAPEASKSGTEACYPRLGHVLSTKGHIAIDYTSYDELDRLLARLVQIKQTAMSVEFDSFRNPVKPVWRSFHT